MLQRRGGEVGGGTLIAGSPTFWENNELVVPSLFIGQSPERIGSAIAQHHLHRGQDPQADQVPPNDAASCVRKRHMQVLLGGHGIPHQLPLP